MRPHWPWVRRSRYTELEDILERAIEAFADQRDGWMEERNLIVPALQLIAFDHDAERIRRRAGMLLEAHAAIEARTELDSDAIRSFLLPEDTP